MCDILKKEFTLSNFGLTYNDQKAFLMAQWQWHPAVYLTYRVIVAMYTMGFFIVNLIIAYLDGIDNILAFLTIWTYLVLALYFLASAIAAFVYRNTIAGEPELHSLQRADVAEKGVINNAYVEIGSEKINNNVTNGVTTAQIAANDQNSDELALGMKFIWVLANIIQVAAILVTVVYFTALYPLIGYTNFVDMNFHGMNTVFVFLDTLMTARPVRLLHVIHPLAYGATYIVFSAVFWSFDHQRNVLYPGVLDWNYPGQTLVWIAGLSFVYMPLMQLVYFGAFRLRLYIYERCYGAKF